MDLTFETDDTPERARRYVNEDVEARDVANAARPETVFSDALIEKPWHRATSDVGGVVITIASGTIEVPTRLLDIRRVGQRQLALGAISQLLQADTSLELRPDSGMGG